MRLKGKGQRRARSTREATREAEILQEEPIGGSQMSPITPLPEKINRGCETGGDRAHIIKR